MSSLYNLTSSYQTMFNSMTESGFDAETIEDTLASYRDDLELKIENCIKYSENQLAVASAKKDLAKKLNDEAEKLEKESSNLIEYVDHNMRKAKIEKLDFDFFKISYRKNPPSVNVVNVDRISNDFMKEKTTYTVDKLKIKKALLNGEVIQGAELNPESKKMVIK